MGTAAKLTSFAVALVAVFGAAFGVGRAVGPLDDEPTSPPAVTTTTTMTTHGGHGGAPRAPRTSPPRRPPTRCAGWRTSRSGA